MLPIVSLVVVVVVVAAAAAAAPPAVPPATATMATMLVKGSAFVLLRIVASCIFSARAG